MLPQRLWARVLSRYLPTAFGVEHAKYEAEVVQFAVLTA